MGRCSPCVTTVDKAEFLQLQKEFNRLTSRSPTSMIQKAAFQEALETVGLFDTGEKARTTRPALLACPSPKPHDPPLVVAVIVALRVNVIVPGGCPRLARSRAICCFSTIVSRRPRLPSLPHPSIHPSLLPFVVPLRGPPLLVLLPLRQRGVNTRVYAAGSRRHDRNQLPGAAAVGAPFAVCRRAAVCATRCVYSCLGCTVLCNGAGVLGGHGRHRPWQVRREAGVYVGHRVSSLPWQNGWLCFRPRLTLFFRCVPLAVLSLPSFVVFAGGMAVRPLLPASSCLRHV